MEKKCFILMPPFEPDDYAKGHFNRVFQYIVSPACRQAGCDPLRLGDPDLDDTPMGILKTIIECDLVICDISSNHTSVMYGFAIRQSLGLPVILIKDIKTQVKANIPEFEIVEYDESLRIDTVENEVPAMSEAIRNALEANDKPNEILTQLNTIIPKVDFPSALEETIVVSIPQEHESETTENELPYISPLPDYVGESLTQSDLEQLNVGDFVFHMNYGKGELLTINKQTKDYLVKLKFDSGTKVLVLTPSDIFRKVIN